MRAEQVRIKIPLGEGLPRAPGVHVSGLIKDMAVSYGLLDKKWVPSDFGLKSLLEAPGNQEEWWDALDDDSKIRMSIGMAWEQWYLPRIPDVSYQPGELSVDGIFLTVDGQSLDVVMTERDRKGYRLAIHEVKTTSKSLNTVATPAGPMNPDSWALDLDSPKNWMWMMQTKAYAKASKSLIVYLHVLFLFGDYSYPMRPKLIPWRITFEQFELDQAWELLQDHLKLQQSKGRA